MRNFLLAGAAAAALLSAHAYAADAVRPIAIPKPLQQAPTTSGYVEVYGQGIWQNNWASYYSPWVGLGVAGRINMWTAPDRSIQVDVAGQTAGDNYYKGYYTSNSLYSALHLSHRDSNHLLGVFGGVAGTSDYEGEYGLDLSGFVGAEAQHYVGPWTFYGQVGYIHQFHGYYGTYYTGELFDYVFAQAEARYFLTPDTKISANIGITSGNIYGSGTPSQYITYAGEIEQKFSDKPLSVFARAEGFNSSKYENYSGYKLMGGIRFVWGSMSLLDQDRKGATLKVMNDLATVGDMRGYD